MPTLPLKMAYLATKNAYICKDMGGCNNKHPSVKQTTLLASDIIMGPVEVRIIFPKQLGKSMLLDLGP